MLPRRARYCTQRRNRLLAHPITSTFRHPVNTRRPPTQHQEKPFWSPPPPHATCLSCTATSSPTVAVSLLPLLLCPAMHRPLVPSPTAVDGVVADCCCAPLVHRPLVPLPPSPSPLGRRRLRLLPSDAPAAALHPHAPFPRLLGARPLPHTPISNTVHSKSTGAQAAAALGPHLRVPGAGAGGQRLRGNAPRQLRGGKEVTEVNAWGERSY